MPSNAAENFSEDAQILIDEAEDKFKHQKLQEALGLAIMAKQRYPQFGDGIDKFITAYQIHTQAMKKKPNGDTDFHAVLGISDTLADIPTIWERFIKLMLLVHPEANSSAAADGAFKHISEAWDVLSQASKRQDYDLRWGLRPSSEKPRSSNSLPDGADSWASSYGGRTCPICGQWCNYGNKNRSYINCRCCSTRYLVQSSSSHSVPPSFSSSSSVPWNSSSHNTEDDPSNISLQEGVEDGF
ncbi:hypothetical protein L1049_016530 [Liquidambar formosana]|uniref:J domain-containing protein n=1 Tax=Liquidambar formosana TaxID=63359 RepID=A0AAP0X6W9_LIQFO